MTPKELWRVFCLAKPDARYIGCEAWHFELTEELANHLLALTLSGIKRATFSSAYTYPNAQYPQVGDYNVVTDWDGQAACILQTVQVEKIPFCEVSWDMAQLEGEDDSLEDWREEHRRVFTEDCEQVGAEFSEVMPVICEEFKVVMRAMDVLSSGALVYDPAFLDAIRAARADTDFLGLLEDYETENHKEENPYEDPYEKNNPYA